MQVFKCYSFNLQHLHSNSVYNSILQEELSLEHQNSERHSMAYLMNQQRRGKHTQTQFYFKKKSLSI